MSSYTDHDEINASSTHIDLKIVTIKCVKLHVMYDALKIDGCDAGLRTSWLNLEMQHFIGTLALPSH